MRSRAELTPEPAADVRPFFDVPRGAGPVRMGDAVVCQCSHTGWWHVQFTFHAGTPHEYRSTAGGYFDRQSAEDYAAMILRECAR